MPLYNKILNGNSQGHGCLDGFALYLSAKNEKQEEAQNGQQVKTTCYFVQNPLAFDDRIVLAQSLHGFCDDGIGLIHQGVRPDTALSLTE